MCDHVGSMFDHHPIFAGVVEAICPKCGEYVAVIPKVDGDTFFVVPLANVAAYN